MLLHCYDSLLIHLPLTRGAFSWSRYLPQVPPGLTSQRLLTALSCWWVLLYGGSGPHQSTCLCSQEASGLEWDATCGRDPLCQDIHCRKPGIPGFTLLGLCQSCQSYSHAPRSPACEQFSVLRQCAKCQWEEKHTRFGYSWESCVLMAGELRIIEENIGALGNFRHGFKIMDCTVWCDCHWLHCSYGALEMT